MSSFESRYAAVSRRALVKGALAFGALTGLPATLAACGSSDEDVFGEPGTGNPGTDAATANSTANSTAPTTEPTVSDATAGTTAGPPATAGGATLADSAELTIDFTFTPSGDGRVRNPYIAVWVEDASGSLVRTISLWYRADESKYLRELSRWNSVDGSDATLDTVSGATKAAGSYSLVWDGTDTDGARVAQGDYVVCIEAAREHGPYELVTAPITLGGESFELDLGADGELTAAVVQFVV